MKTELSSIEQKLKARECSFAFLATDKYKCVISVTSLFILISLPNTRHSFYVFISFDETAQKRWCSWKKKKKKKNIRSPFYLGRSRSVRRVTNLSSDNYSRRVTRFATFQFPSPSKSINYNRASNYSVRGRRLFVFSRKKKVSLSRRPGLSRCASSVRREHAFLVVSFHPSPRGISHSRLRRALLCAYVIADKAATFHDDRWFNLFFLPFIHVTDS